MSLADYLAKNYLTADSKPEKKSKKRKRKEALSGLIIADDDSLGWDPHGKAKEDEDGPVTISSNSAEFRKSKSNNWRTITGAPVPPQLSSEQATADAIIASATAESQALQLADEDAPAVSTDPSLPKMVKDRYLAHDVSADVESQSSGAHAGLSTASQVGEQIARAQEQECQRFLAEGDEHSGRGKETIYRDASGRRIDIGMKRREARLAAEAAALKAAADLEAQKGDKQRADREARKEKLAEAKFLPVARFADDNELNDEMRERERWNDPAAQFLSQKKEGKSVTGKPLYKGAAMPNRYGIRPGHRWDGVDRGNGFEKEYFKAGNRRRNLKELDYAWQMDE